MSIVPPIQEFETFEAETVKLLTPPFRYKFGPVRWEDQDKEASRPYQWQVAGMLPHGETILWYGESQSGKSFTVFNAGVHVAAGMEFQGRRVRRGGVIYCAIEKGRGAINRMKAFRQHYDLPTKGFPFAVLTKRIDIFTSEETIDDLITECREIAAPWDVPLDVIIIDTHDKATPGASEIDKKDISTVMARYERLRDGTGAGIWVVGHSNAYGSLRGSLVLYNAIETVVSIARLGDKQNGDYHDANGRIIREARIVKQSEGEAGTRWKFVLPAVEIGRNEHDEPVTSCVVEAPAEKEGDSAADKSWRPIGHDAMFLRALVKAIEDFGVEPPPHLGLPPSIRKVVHYDHVKMIFRDMNPDDGDDSDRHRETLKKALQRARLKTIDRRVVNVANPYIWPTGVTVVGINGLSGNFMEQNAEPPRGPDSPGVAEYMASNGETLL